MIWILFLITLTIFLYVKVVKPYNYWINKGVKQRKQVYFFGDNARAVFGRESFFDIFINAYNAFPEERYMGFYQMTKPALVLRDPELIKQITVKDFDHFVDHNELIPEDNDPLWSRNLVTLKGEQWHQMRAILSPSFTSAKMKIIFNLISECADNYLEYFKKSKEVNTVELKDLFTRYANDVIATVAFGLKCDSINNQSNEFYTKGRELTTKTFSQPMKFFMYVIMPRICKLLGMTLFPRQLGNYFKQIVLETIKFREENGIVRPDILHLLLEAKKGIKKRFDVMPTIDTGFATVEETIKPEHSKSAKITDIDIAAQAVLFFFGGFDTVSTAMSFMGYELAVNSDIQEKLQKEIDVTFKHCPDGKLTYECLMKMRYMDMVVSETLRKWPPGIALNRVCTKKYTIEPVKPHEHPVQLNPGDLVFILTTAIHRDPKYYPNPDKFDPERFSDENKERIHPYAYHPFGLGPRNCIGSRFALMEIKCIFFHLLRTFDFVVVEKTEIPLQLAKKSFMMTTRNGTWIGLKPRNT